MSETPADLLALSQNSDALRPDPAHQRGRPFLFGVLVIIAVVVVFARSAAFDFTLWDEHLTIVTNPRLNPPSLADVAYYWSHPEYYLYIPVTYTVWSIVAAFAREGTTLDPFYFHAANVLIHAGSAAACFAILSRLFRADIPALLGALLFALHPLQVEAVAWVSGTKDLLGCCFALLSIWQFVCFRQAPRIAKQRLHYAATLVFMLLGMLSKPGAVVVPGMLLVIDVLVLAQPWRKALRAIFPLLIAAVPFIIVTKLVQTAPRVDSPLWLRPFVAGDALAFYFGKLLLPINLAIDYGRRPGVMRAHAWFYPLILIPILLLIGALAVRRHSRVPLAALLLFVIGVLPVLGLVPFVYQMFSTTADHYVLLAMLGPALLLTWALSRCRQPALHWAMAGMLIVMSLMTYRQLAVWQNSFTLFSHAIAVNPDSFSARNNLAAAYAGAGDLDQSLRYLEQSRQLNPDYPGTHQALGEVLVACGDFDRAIAAFNTYLAMEAAAPDADPAALARSAFNMAGRFHIAGRTDIARVFLQRAAKYDPQNQRVRDALVTTAASQPTR